MLSSSRPSGKITGQNGGRLRRRCGRPGDPLREPRRSGPRPTRPASSSATVRPIPSPSSSPQSEPLSRTHIPVAGAVQQPGELVRLPQRDDQPLGFGIVSMKKGSVSSSVGSSASGSSRGLGVWSSAHVSMASSSGGSGEIGTFARGRMSKRAVRPPDEKRRLVERTPHLEKACARSRGRGGGRCRPGRPSRRVACRAGACCAGSALGRPGV
jgi:hypothetical protein